MLQKFYTPSTVFKAGDKVCLDLNETNNYIGKFRKVKPFQKGKTTHVVVDTMTKQYGKGGYGNTLIVKQGLAIKDVQTGKVVAVDTVAYQHLEEV